MQAKVTNHKKKDNVKLGQALKANLQRRKQQKEFKEEQDLAEEDSSE